MELTNLQKLPAPLLAWYDEHRRVLPWREQVSPYRTWVSEIMLQQTRVQAVLPYFQRFLEIIRQSGYSSYMYLQNVSPAGAVKQQDMAITLALCEHYLEGAGAYRVHGGGFAGTCQAFVPEEKLEDFRSGIDGVLGIGACHVLSIRPQGGVEVTV